MLRPRHHQVANRYELFSCGLSGHFVVGADAATVTEADAPLVRDAGGLRWVRCLRCDSWLPVPRPTGAAGPAVPGRDEIQLPLRGPALRDRYVLRLIALDRALHVVVLAGLALAVLFFLHHRNGLEHDYQSIMNSLTGAQPNGLRGLLGHLHHLFVIAPSHLYEVAIVALAYGALEATEMVGLWYAKRWAEYLTLIATVAFVPLEVYELTSSVSALKLVVLAINVAVVVYLLWAKRLFGVRGGHRALVAMRAEKSGWPAVDAATPPLPDLAGDRRVGAAS